MITMLYGNRVMCLSLLAVSLFALQPRSAHGGPFLEWLFGGRRQAPAYPVGPSFPVVGNQLGTYYGASMPIVGPNGYGYAYQSPGGVASAALPQPTVAYLPDYRSTYYRAPVTYYRPILSTDPSTGAQVVALAPCTSYEYQTQRVPTIGTQPYYGWYGPSQVPTLPQASRQMPMSTLPTGGVPLASLPNAGYSMGYPNYGPILPGTYSQFPYGNVGGYVSGYGAYSPGQLPIAPAPTMSFPTNPYGSNEMYGTVSGGCTGTFAPAPVPVTPGQGYPMPSSVLPPNSLESAPAMQPQVNGPFPSQSAPSSSPGANERPSLPQSSLPQSSAKLDPPTLDPNRRFQSVVRQPISSSDPTTDPRRPNSAPQMEPIPVPEEYKNIPRWNPGLLKESDQTAQVQEPVLPALHTEQGYSEQDWGSKRIQWASFTQPASPEVIHANAETSVRESETDTLKVAIPAQDNRSQLRLSPRSTDSTPASANVHEMPDKPKDQQPHRRTDGWKRSR